ncbi:MAG: hypothetical protein Q9187_003072 [Circinaria calcarea]
MAMATDEKEELLSPPNNEEYPTLDRLPSYYNPLQTYNLAKADQKHYQQQYADIYFLRLAKLKPEVEKVAAEAWSDFQVRQWQSYLLKSSRFNWKHAGWRGNRQTCR